MDSMDSKIFKKKKKYKCIVLIIVFLLMGLIIHPRSGNAQDNTFKEIQEAVKAHSANWFAGVTSMSKLTLGGRQARLGYLYLENVTLLKQMGIGDQVNLETDLPEKLDWRSYNGKNDCPGISEIEGELVQIQDWDYAGGSPNSTDIKAIKNALLEGPVSTWMTVFTDFYYYAGGIYEYVYGEEEGAHTVTIIGWDNTTSPPCWIVKNSWGTDWGESGYFRIKMENNEANIVPGTCYPKVMPQVGDGTLNFTFEGSPTYSLVPPLTVSFVGQNVNPADNLVWGWQFDFGDETDTTIYTLNNPVKVKHTYTSCGNYTVTVTGMDENYATSVVTKTDYINLCIEEPQPPTQFVWLKVYNQMFTDQESENILSILRRFRDEILMADDQGKKLVHQLYEEHSSELMRIFLTHPRLAKQGASIIKENLTCLVSVLNGEKISVNRSNILTVGSLLDEISSIGNSELKEYIGAVKQVMEEEMANWGIDVNDEARNERPILEKSKGSGSITRPKLNNVKRNWKNRQHLFKGD